MCTINQAPSTQLVLSSFFFYCYADHRDLHSFPTRRSSDLPRVRHDCDGPGRTVAGGDWPSSVLGAASRPDRKSTRLNSSHVSISYAVFCLKKKKTRKIELRST